LIAAMALCLVACEENKSASPSATAPTGAAPAGTGAATAAAGQMAQADDIPDESDFDEEAEKTITAGNLEAEIDKLEKEIGQ
jgi:hypothetical protein